MDFWRKIYSSVPANVESYSSIMQYNFQDKPME